MQRMSFPILLLGLFVIYSKECECVPLSSGESPTRYSHDYVYSLPLNIDLLNYYMEQQAEDNAASERAGRDQFIRASRSNPEGLREHLFNTWIKKGRGSIRPADSNAVQLKKFIRMSRGVRKIFTRVARK